MKEVTVTVIDPVGLHARPATVAVNAASKFKSEIKIAYKGKAVNMKSIMGVMSLGIPTQSEIVISAEGEDQDEAVETIVDVLKTQKVIGQSLQFTQVGDAYLLLFIIEKNGGKIWIH